jgi:hypothetical protein
MSDPAPPLQTDPAGELLIFEDFHNESPTNLSVAPRFIPTTSHIPKNALESNEHILPTHSTNPSPPNNETGQIPPYHPPSNPNYLTANFGPIPPSPDFCNTGNSSLSQNYKTFDSQQNSEILSITQKISMTTSDAGNFLPIDSVLPQKKNLFNSKEAKDVEIAENNELIEILAEDEKRRLRRAQEKAKEVRRIEMAY